MFSITRNCGRCGNLVDFRLKYAGECGQVEPTREVFSTALSSYHAVPSRTFDDHKGSKLEAYGLAFCPRCNGPTLLEFNSYQRYLQNIVSSLDEEHGFFGGQSLVAVTASFPPAKEPDIDPAWPSELVRHFADAQRMIDQNMTPSIIVGICRSVLDMATKQLGVDVKEKNLAKRIDRLLSDGIITKPIADWAHVIRVDGNDAVHDGIGNIEDAREYIAFLRMFLNVAFTLPKRIEERNGKG